MMMIRNMLAKKIVKRLNILRQEIVLIHSPLYYWAGDVWSGELEKLYQLAKSSTNTTEITSNSGRIQTNNWSPPQGLCNRQKLWIDALTRPTTNTFLHRRPSTPIFENTRISNWVKCLSHQPKVSKVKHYFGGFWASKLHTSYLSILEHYLGL